jgi:hypothetical protein
MGEDRTGDLVEDIIDGIASGELAESLPTFSVTRREKLILDVDLGDREFTYVVTVSRVQRGTDV